MGPLWGRTFYVSSCHFWFVNQWQPPQVLLEVSFDAVRQTCDVSVALPGVPEAERGTGLRNSLGGAAQFPSHFGFLKASATQKRLPSQRATGDGEAGQLLLEFLVLL